MGTVSIGDTIVVPGLGQFKAGADLKGTVAGVYALMDAHDWPVYIGQSQDVAKRVTQHAGDGRAFHAFRYLALDDRAERLRVEGILILAYRPPENAMVCLRVTPATVAEVPYTGLYQRRKKRAKGKA